MIITENAIAAYISNVEPCTRDQAIAAIASAERGVAAAAKFGAHVVKTAKAKLLLDGETVVTCGNRHWIDNLKHSMAEREERLRAAHERDEARRRRFGSMQ